MPRRSSGEYEFAAREPKKIDARATRLDMSGQVIDPKQQGGEKAYTGIRRGMGGEPLAGKNILTKEPKNFPQAGSGSRAMDQLAAAERSIANRRRVGPDGYVIATENDVREFDATKYLPKANTPVRGPTPGGAPMAPTVTGFPRSGMTSGNAAVQFQAPAEIAAGNAKAAKTKWFADGRAATERDRAAAASPAAVLTQANGLPGVMRRPDGTPGGLVTGKTGFPQLTSIYGSGSARFAKPGEPLGTRRIVDNGKDVTADYQVGGKKSSFPAPKATFVAAAKPAAPKLDGVARGSASLNPDGSNEATAIPSGGPKVAGATPIKGTEPAPVKAPVAAAAEPGLPPGISREQFNRDTTPKTKPTAAPVTAISKPAAPFYNTTGMVDAVSKGNLTAATNHAVQKSAELRGWARRGAATLVGATADAMTGTGAEGSAVQRGLRGVGQKLSPFPKAPSTAGFPEFAPASTVPTTRFPKAESEPARKKKLVAAY